MMLMEPVDRCFIEKEWRALDLGMKLGPNFMLPRIGAAIKLSSVGFADFGVGGRFSGEVDLFSTCLKAWLRNAQ
jgi:hypothetical protein